MNYMKHVAKLFDLKLGEEFKVVGYPDNIFMFTVDGLVAKFTRLKSTVAYNALLCDLLTDKAHLIHLIAGRKGEITKMYTLLDAIRDIQNKLELEYSNIADEITLKAPVAHDNKWKGLMTYHDGLYQVIELLERIIDMGVGIEEGYSDSIKRDNAEPVTGSEHLTDKVQHKRGVEPNT